MNKSNSLPRAHRRAACHGSTLATGAIVLMLSLPLSAEAAPRGNSSGPGTGSTFRSNSVQGHIRNDGSYVAPHMRSNPDRSFNNNWSTNPNVNPYTGQQGTRVTPPGGYGNLYGNPYGGSQR